MQVLDPAKKKTTRAGSCATGRRAKRGKMYQMFALAASVISERVSAQGASGNLLRGPDRDLASPVPDGRSLQPGRGLQAGGGAPVLTRVFQMPRQGHCKDDQNRHYRSFESIPIPHLTQDCDHDVEECCALWCQAYRAPGLVGLELWTLFEDEGDYYYENSSRVPMCSCLYSGEVDAPEHPGSTLRTIPGSRIPLAWRGTGPVAHGDGLDDTTCYPVAEYVASGAALVASIPAGARGSLNLAWAYKDGCVSGNNIRTLTDNPSLFECADACNDTPSCVGFEQFREDVAHKRAGDCILSSSQNTAGCDNDHWQINFFYYDDYERIVNSQRAAASLPAGERSPNWAYKNGCVSGNNIQTLTENPSLEDCADACNDEPSCVGIEQYREDVGSKRAGDCILSSSQNTAGCDNARWQINFYYHDNEAVQSAVALLPTAVALPAGGGGTITWAYRNGCVRGNNIRTLRESSLIECAQACIDEPDCVGIEEYREDVQHRRAGDCTLSSSQNTDDCDNAHWQINFFYYT